MVSYYMVTRTETKFVVIKHNDSLRLLLLVLHG